jgi:hypothetical protein
VKARQLSSSTEEGDKVIMYFCLALLQQQLLSNISEKSDDVAKPLCFGSMLAKLPQAVF